jgi:bifunctional DNA primase/polymerase-like protein/primase-like protein/AAA domain-containing protein
VATLGDLAGKPCPRHARAIHVGLGGKAAYCEHGEGETDFCRSEELRAWATSLNGHVTKTDAPEDGESTGASSHHDQTVEEEQVKRSAGNRNGQVRYAIAYARRNIKVFPCHDIEADRECSCGKLQCPSAGKHPRLKDWQGLATTDEGQIGKWWKEWPNANIGVKCGMDSDLTVLDVDGDEGRDTLRALELEHGELPETPIAITGSGGAHYYFRFEADVLGKARFAPGLDFRTEGNLVVGVGSKTKRRYEWEAVATLGDLQPARMPRWLAALSPKGKPRSASNGHDPVSAEDARDMLMVVPADDRQTWLDIGMALKSNFGQSGRGLWDEWSRKSAKFDDKDQGRTWDSIDVDGGITIGTLIKRAQEGGWARRSANAIAISNGHPVAEIKPRVPAIIAEDYDAAVLSNAEYLQRPMIIDRLGFSQGIALAVGGKHMGKTTNVRTVALSVMQGLPVWDRETRQGYVIYAASDDEYPTTRMELLRMGWRANSDPLKLVRINPEQAAEPEAVLADLADLANSTGAILIILDMLFDFARIKDEMGYAHTREAVGKIQTLADQTKALILATHHSPKYMTDAMSAATAALGSQGIAARFSPIILTRKWADDLYTVDSTTTRDPRGVAIPPTCLTLDAQGWCRTAGEFKAWMKWKMFAERVMGMFEGGEPGRELSVEAISRDLELSRQIVQNTLYNLFKARKLEREKKGKGYRYWLPIEQQDVLGQTDVDFERKTYGGESQD